MEANRTWFTTRILPARDMRQEVERRRVHYKGEGGGFPQVQAVVSLVCPELLVAHPNTKSAPTMH